MSKILVFIIRIYQNALSPFFPSSCRFYPTCSHYAVEAIQTHGSLYGSYLSFRRILRCNPFHKGGLDPVPEKNQCNHHIHKI